MEEGVVIGVQQIINLSADPNRETMWNFEVVNMGYEFYLKTPPYMGLPSFHILSIESKCGLEASHLPVSSQY